MNNNHYLQNSVELLQVIWNKTWQEKQKGLDLTNYLLSFSAKLTTIIYFISNKDLLFLPVPCWSNEIQATMYSVVWKWCSEHS